VNAYDPHAQESTAATLIDPDLHEPSPSTGWEEACAILGVATDVEPPADALDAATRPDRPRRYRRKHLLGVTT
jgi:hypothetical protein